ncbi:10113_t:CDS:2, partial [Diversispora eburnea]
IVMAHQIQIMELDFLGNELAESESLDVTFLSGHIAKNNANANHSRAPAQIYIQLSRRRAKMVKMSKLNLHKVLEAFSSERIHLPNKPLNETRLPYPLASDVSVRDYNSFIENQESSVYKFEYKSGTVYIVEMISPEHEAVVDALRDYFRAHSPLTTYAPPNAPIQTRGSPGHHSPAGDGTFIMPDLAVYPHRTYVPVPPVPGPPSDMRATLWRQGVEKQKWKFGTVNKDDSPTDATGCNGPNDPNYIITIPVSDVFYDLAIPAIGYTPLPPPPPALMTANFRIDLYQVQQMVLISQQV